VRALYRWVIAKHPQRKPVAIGHAMRKLSRLVFALWKSDKHFDGRHYPWEGPVAEGGGAQSGGQPAGQGEGNIQAAGHKPDTKPAEPVVTAACAATVPPGGPAGEGIFIDFAHRKSQLSLARILEHLGLSARLRGSGPQRRCACPIHRADGRGRAFSVNLEDNVFHCFEARCGAEGDVIDLWAALQHLDLRAAAIELVQTFDLDPAPGPLNREEARLSIVKIPCLLCCLLRPGYAPMRGQEPFDRPTIAVDGTLRRALTDTHARAERTGLLALVIFG
jgi:hypothetical protein